MENIKSILNGFYPLYKEMSAICWKVRGKSWSLSLDDITKSKENWKSITSKLSGSPFDSIEEFNKRFEIAIKKTKDQKDITFLKDFLGESLLPIMQSHLISLASEEIGTSTIEEGIESPKLLNVFNFISEETFANYDVDGFLYLTDFFTKGVIRLGFGQHEQNFRVDELLEDKTDEEIKDMLQEYFPHTYNNHVKDGSAPDLTYDDGNIHLKIGLHLDERFYEDLFYLELDLRNENVIEKLSDKVDEVEIECGECDGSGTRMEWESCSVCGGDGEIWDEEDEEHINCYECDGTGEVSSEVYCSNCDGSGTCSRK